MFGLSFSLVSSFLQTVLCVQEERELERLVQQWRRLQVSFASCHRLWECFLLVGIENASRAFVCIIEDLVLRSMNM